MRAANFRCVTAVKKYYGLTNLLDSMTRIGYIEFNLIRARVVAILTPHFRRALVLFLAPFSDKFSLDPTHNSSFCLRQRRKPASGELARIRFSIVAPLVAANAVMVFPLVKSNT